MDAHGQMTLRGTLAAAILFSAACVSSGRERPEHPEARAGGAAVPDTVSFAAHGDSFFVVIRGDTTQVYRIDGADTAYVSRGVVRRPAGDRAAGGQAAAALAIPQAIPEPWEPDTSRAPDPGVRTASAEPDTLPIHSVGANVSFEAYAVAEVSKFLAVSRTDSSERTGPTPEAWREVHPGDRLERSDSGQTSGWWYQDFAGRWCARSTRRVRTADGRVSVRRVLFYPPDMPESAQLPTVSDEVGRDFAECRLGGLQIETDVAEAAGDSLGVALHEALTARLGSQTAVPRPAAVSAYRWDRYAAWRAGEATVVTTAEGGYQKMRVIAAAWTPGAGLDLPDPYRWGAAVPGEEADREIAILGGLDPDTARGLLEAATAASRPTDPSSERARRDSLFLDQLEAWIGDASDLGREGRAAALMIADRALATAALAGEFARPDSAAVRRRLLGIGATLERLWGEGYHYRYAGELLLEAYEIARGTPVGDQAFLRLLALGFDPSPNCPETDAFRVIIDRGEPILIEARGGRPIDPAVRAKAHQLVAEAHADIIAIVAGLAPEAWITTDPEDSVRYGPEDVAAARRRALGHYQAALDLMRPSPQKEAVWRDAWRLAGGLPPHATRHICAWD